MKSERKRKTILITRDREGNRELAKKLRAAGCRVVCWETFRCVRVPPTKKLQQVLQQIDCFDWLVFTSPRAVKFFMKQIGHIGLIRRIKVAVVGSATAKATHSFGLRVALVSKIATAKGLAAEHVFQKTKGFKIFFPKASDARSDFEKILGCKHRITSCVVYRKKFVKHTQEQIKRLLRQKIDCVHFYSPSAIKAIGRELGRRGFVQLVRLCCVRVKGETTQRALHNFLRPAFHNVERERC